MEDGVAFWHLGVSENEGPFYERQMVGSLFQGPSNEVPQFSGTQTSERPKAKWKSFPYSEIIVANQVSKANAHDESSTWGVPTSL